MCTWSYNNIENGMERISRLSSWIYSAVKSATERNDNRDLQNRVTETAWVKLCKLMWWCVRICCHATWFTQGWSHKMASQCGRTTGMIFAGRNGLSVYPRSEIITEYCMESISRLSPRKVKFTQPPNGMKTETFRIEWLWVHVNNCKLFVSGVFIFVFMLYISRKDDI